MTAKLTERQRIEKETFDRLAKEKLVGKSLTVSVDQPSFADYNGDLFFGATKVMEFQGKHILEIGCGSGEIATWLALNGAQKVTGVDISSESIRIAERRAIENNISDRVEFLACPGESVPKPDESFDVIFINVALHHLDLPSALSECSRLLIRGGLFVAVEPLVRSAFMQHIRESRVFQTIYPVRRESTTENILSMNDITLVEKTFGNLNMYPYRIFSPFIYKIKPLFYLLSRVLFARSSNPETRRQRCNHFLQHIDNMIILTFPFLKKASRYSILVARKN